MSVYNSKKTLDWITICAYISLMLIGLLMLYSTQHNSFVFSHFVDFDSVVGRQALWVFVSFIAFIVVTTIDWKLWQTFAYLIYAACILILIAVLIFGVEVKGATAWIRIFGFSLQPSEFAKLGICLALSSIFTFSSTNKPTTKSFLIPVGLILLPIFLVLLQPDAGTAIIYLSFFVILYKEGLSPIYFVLAISFALVFIFSLMFSPSVVLFALFVVAMIVFCLQQEKKYIWMGAVLLMTIILAYLSSQGFITQALIGLGVLTFLFLGILFQQRKSQFAVLLGVSILFLSTFSFGASHSFHSYLKPHQQERINVWLRPDKCDPQGSLYNIIQSKLAISAGGFQGKGFMQGNMTKLNYVPEQSTDFIFSTVGEEQGFVGSLGIILLFTILLFRIINIGLKSNKKFVNNYAIGLAGLIFAHYFINVGMTIGIMPVVGIPLPFMSKGGSSLLTFSIMIGILIKMDLDRYSR